MAEYILAPDVEAELWLIWEFIAADNPDAATKVVETAFATFKTLADNPGLGRLRQFRQRALKGVRSFPVSGFENYLIFYREQPAGIDVLHVYHGARDIEALLDGN